MATNLDAVKEQLEELVEYGESLVQEITKLCLYLRGANSGSGTSEGRLAFGSQYQRWYTEAREVIRQLTPAREADFVSIYEGEKRTKWLTSRQYGISDYIVAQTLPGERVDEVACVKLQTQVGILKAAQARLESKLFDIVTIARGDLHACELDGARELLKNKYERAAGVVAGVVLEGHLKQVATNHNVKLPKKKLTLSDLNEALKKAGVYDVATWRFIAFLADCRNLCGHKSDKDPTAQQVSELIEGTDKMTKTLF